MKKTIALHLPDVSTKILLPLYELGLFAGFPSPAQDYAATPIDLNVALLLDSGNTRIIKVQDNDLAGVHIFEGDLAIIDTGIIAGQGDKICCSLDGERMNRIVGLDKEDQSILLYTTHPKITPVKLSPDRDYIVNGIITYTITSHIPTGFYDNKNNDGSIDINKWLIRNRASTFLGIIKGNSMEEAGVFDGDLAVIDRSLPYISGYKALCRIKNKFTVKYLEWDNENTLWLIPANRNFPPIKTEKDDSVVVWGIVTHTITPHTRKFNLL